MEQSESKNIPKVVLVFCRFCLSQENLSSISADDFLQIMICPTLTMMQDDPDDDEDPAYICEDCRRLIQHSHNFHRMCKKANKLLAQYQFTGVLPMPLEKPSFSTLLKISTADASTNTEYTTQTTSILTSTASQTDDEYTGENAEETNMPETEALDEMSLDEEAGQEEADQSMFSEILVLNEPCGTDENLCLEENDEFIGPGNETPDEEDSGPPFDCNFCELTFPLRQLRDIHLNEHSRVRKFECDKCNKKFFTKKDLNQHESVHTGERPFVCKLCGKGYTRKSSLDRHESRHAEVPKYMCIYCDKSLPSRVALEDHIKSHESAEKFICNICYKSFGYRKNLIRHSALHQKVYTCEYCDEGFSTQKKLTAHLLTHKDAEIVYYCEKCEKTFPNTKQFNRHMHQHSLISEKMLKCFYCNSNFQNREEYVKHTAIHSKENLICTLCMMQFQDVVDIDAEVEEHIKLHVKGDVFSCEFCNFLCLTETELSLHTC